eukprot:7552770-Lingulodinium_polyedra.AAC.1
MRAVPPPAVRRGPGLLDGLPGLPGILGGEAPPPPPPPLRFGAGPAAPPDPLVSRGIDPAVAASAARAGIPADEVLKLRELLGAAPGKLLDPGRPPGPPLGPAAALEAASAAADDAEARASASPAAGNTQELLLERMGEILAAL